MPTPSAPAPDATQVPLGTHHLRGTLPMSLTLTVLGGGGVAGVCTALVSHHAAGQVVGGLFGLAILGFLAFFGVTMTAAAWQGRGAVVYVDGTGLWLHNQHGGALIRWDSLAGVGVFWSKAGRGATQYSIELCPLGPIDRDHPVLWPLVRDEEPLRPGLPRLRYRLGVRKRSGRVLDPAIQARVPHLWFGTVERDRLHVGLPDVKGHRLRTSRAS
ncbi:hypothetical protein ACQUSR_11405 [Streptomyces sp. P1-3]|uniref:hypothetical protein n=1 Tax=Streptomyces sp. P1-3 TaxID=3421658 RepID=UPI003D363633